MTDTTRAVARYDGPRTTDDLVTYSRELAFSTRPDGTWRANDTLPAAFRGNPAGVAFAVEYAKALDVSPITALIGIHLVDGKPTASAGLISALVRRAGHKIRTFLEGSISEGTAVGVTQIVRADDPDFTYESRWDLDRAVRANLMKRTPDGRVVAVKDRSAWSTYPESMLKARSLTECARDAAEDAILGVHYTPEELGVEVDESGDPVHVVTTVPSTRTDTQTPAAGGPPPSTAGSTTGGGETTQTPPPPVTTTPATPGDTPIAVVDDVRRRILRATTPADLVAVWESIAPNQAEKTRAWSIGDDAGAETTVFDLFTRQGDAIKAGNPLVDLTGGRDGDEGGTPAEPSDDPGSGPETGGEGRTYTDVEEAITDATRPPNDVVDAVVVEDPPQPERTYRSVLDGVVAALTREQLDDVTSWCRLNGAHPDQGDDHCRVILAAIKDGTAFSFANRPEDPVALVEAILGGTVIETEQITDPAELHRRELEERREEARQATPAGHGPRGSGHDAYAAARAGIHKTTDQ